MLELLRRVHHPRQWLIVTTPSATLDLNVGTIDDEGLFDLRSPDRSDGIDQNLRIVYVAWPEDSARVRPVDATSRMFADLSPLALNVSTRDVLRLRGSFGRFTGRVSNIDARGSVVLERAAGLDPELPVPAEPLTWDEITRVERRGGSSRSLAISAATVVGITTGALAAWVSAAIGNQPRDITGAFVLGSMAGSLAGAGSGALIGAFIPSWHRLYDRFDARHSESI